MATIEKYFAPLAAAQPGLKPLLGSVRCDIIAQEKHLRRGIQEIDYLFKKFYVG